MKVKKNIKFHFLRVLNLDLIIFKGFPYYYIYILNSKGILL